MSEKIVNLIVTASMGLGGLALGGYLVIHHQVAIGSALIGAVSSAWFLHHTTSATIGSLLQSVVGTASAGTAAPASEASKPATPGSSL